MGMIIVFTVWFATGCAGSGAERRSGQADSPPPSPARRPSWTSRTGFRVKLTEPAPSRGGELRAGDRQRSLQKGQKMAIAPPRRGYESEKGGVWLRHTALHAREPRRGREAAAPAGAAGAAPERGSYGPTVAKYSFARSVPVVWVKKGVNPLPMLSSPT
jgi:hypothetical protein